MKKFLFISCSALSILSGEASGVRFGIEEISSNMGKRFFSTYKIHPAIGVPRLGNSDEFYIEPHSIGGLPRDKNNSQKEITKFKDSQNRILKQAAHFRIYKDNKPLEKGDSNIASVTWKAYLANKKPAWWNFNEFCGDLMLNGAMVKDNSYKYWSTQQENCRPIVSLRNPSTIGNARQSLIINPGYRFVNKDHKFADFDITGLETLAPYPIKTLGQMILNEDNSLFLLGGNGHTGGIQGAAPIDGFGGGDGWYDDISDGPVEASITFKDGTSQTLGAWAIVGSPKYAPEIVNNTTWDDTILDMAVRKYNAFPEMFDAQSQKFILGEAGYWPSFKEDILPIIQRMKNYEWVSNTGPMVFFSNPNFDMRDNRKENAQNRKDWFQYLRAPVDLRESIKDSFVLSNTHNTLYKSKDLYPMMPLNSGDNSVRNQNVSKFNTFSPLQYYMMHQWSEGFFHNDKESAFLSSLKINHRDRASVGNCVGYPMSPGIETTWNVRNPNIYDAVDFYRIKHAQPIESYNNQLDPSRDETESRQGCQPGDLTKRMAMPWQADFLNCSVQNVNFTDPARNKAMDKDGNLVPIKPTYYTYWWPAQAPWDVYTSNASQEEQDADGNPSGVKVNFQRGINTYMSMIRNWSNLGFIANQNTNDRLKNSYPYFTEQERNLDAFKVSEASINDEGKAYNASGVTERENNVDVTTNLYYSPGADSPNETSKKN